MFLSPPPKEKKDKKERKAIGWHLHQENTEGKSDMCAALKDDLLVL